MSKITKIKYGLILAAGEGKRMGYLSNLLPKCLFPLSDRPILHYVINQMEKVGIERIYIVVKTHKEKIEEYIKAVKQNIKPKISLIKLKKLGTINDSILSGEKYLKEPFTMILGDDCTIVDSLSGMIKDFLRKKPIVIEGMVRENDKRVLKDTCCAKLDKEGKIIEILEKPDNPLHKLRGCGVYIFDPKIFDYIKKTSKDKEKKQLGITETINLVAKEGLAQGYILNGQNVNINSYNDLIKANLLLKKCQKS